MEKTKFSIIICTYNMGDCIEHAITSILNQNFKNYEIIIYNDASKDNTKEVLQKINNNRVLVINSEKNIGLGASRNVAIQNAKGEYILFLDADDTLYSNDTLDKINKVIEKDDPDIAYFGVHYIGGSNKTYIPNAQNSTKKARILCDMHFAVSSKCWKKSFLIEKDIKFPENVYYEDMFYSIKATILANKISYGEFPIYNYVRNRNGGIMSTPNIKKCADMYRIIAYILELYDITPIEYRPYLLSFIKQETENIPHKTCEILKAYEEGINSPVFSKRNYKFEKNDSDIWV